MDQHMTKIVSEECAVRLREVYADLDAAHETPLRPDEPAVIAAVTEIYRRVDRECPEIVVMTPGEIRKTGLASHAMSTIAGIGLTDIVERIALAEELLARYPELADQKLRDLPDVSVWRPYVRRVACLTPCEEVAIITPWPDVWKRDDRHRLHCADGAALIYRRAADGVEEFGNFWHGVRLPAWVFDAEITADQLRSVTRAEQRRALIECLGVERYITILGLAPIHEATYDGLAYRLYAGEDCTYLAMQSPPRKNGSQPWYYEPAHEDCRTCMQARAYRVGLPLDTEIRFEVQA